MQLGVTTLGARGFLLIEVTELSTAKASRDQHYSLWHSSPLASKKTSGIQGKLGVFKHEKNTVQIGNPKCNSVFY